MVIHPVLQVFLAAADGEFPPADGKVTFVPPPSDGLEAVVSLTGHAYVATALTETDLGDLAWMGSAKRCSLRHCCALLVEAAVLE